MSQNRSARWTRRLAALLVGGSLLLPGLAPTAEAREGRGPRAAVSSEAAPSKVSARRRRPRRLRYRKLNELLERFAREAAQAEERRAFRKVARKLRRELAETRLGPADAPTRRGTAGVAASSSSSAVASEPLHTPGWAREPAQSLLPAPTGLQSLRVPRVARVAASSEVDADPLAGK